MSRPASSATTSRHVRWKSSAASASRRRCATPDCRRTIPTTWSIAPRFLGREITRIKIPCRAERYTAKDGPDTWWPTPEPPHRINQIYLEPVLFAHCRQCQARAFSTARHWSISRKDDGRSHRAVATSTAAARSRFPAKFLIGCDGGRSLVRKKIGATLSGDVALQRVQSSYIRAPKLLDMLLQQGGTPAWGSFALNARQSGNVYAIDGKRELAGA